MSNFLSKYITAKLSQLLLINIKVDKVGKVNFYNLQRNTNCTLVVVNYYFDGGTLKY